MRLAVVTLVIGLAWGSVRMAGRALPASQLRINGWPLAVVALCVHLLTGGGGEVARIAGNLISGACLLSLALVNHALPGMAALTAGVVANGLVIMANAGMPVSARAVERMGGSAISLPAAGPHHLLTPDTSLAWLADVWGAPWLGVILSPGDLLLVLGSAGLLAAIISPPGRPGQRREAAHSRVAANPSSSLVHGFHPRSSAARRGDKAE